MVTEKVTLKRIVVFNIVLLICGFVYLHANPWIELQTSNIDSYELGKAFQQNKGQNKMWIGVATKSTFPKEAVSTSVPDSRLEKYTLTIRGDEIQFDHSYCKSVAISQSEQHEGCPSLFIIGTRKGGTTSLINYLSKHPNFKVANPGGGLQSGETFFFNRHDKFNDSTWRTYLSKFPKDSNANLSGESTVFYSTNCLVPNRIQRACGSKAKIVYLLRNPYRRFESNYLMRVKTKVYGPKSDINAIFEAEWKRLSVVLGSRYNFNQRTINMSVALDLNCAMQKGAPNLLYDGLYLTFLANWLCVWPAENMLVINSEEFFKMPGKIVQQVLLFLGLDNLSDETLSAITSSVYNKGIQSKSVSLNSRNRMLIQNLYEPFNSKLLDLLQWTSSVDWVY